MRFGARFDATTRDGSGFEFASARSRGFAAAGTETETESDEAQRKRQKKLSEDRDNSRVLTERLFTAAMKRVPEHGWSAETLRLAASDLGYSPAVVGQIPGSGAGSLVHHFCQECDSRLSVKVVMEGEDLLRDSDSSPSDRLATVIKWRLRMLEPLIEQWPSALAIQAAPENAARTATRVALLADELVGAMGAGGVGLSRATRTAIAPAQDPIPMDDESETNARLDETDSKTFREVRRDASSPFHAAAASAGWYADRAAVAALYGACELFMVTDTSADFKDTRGFVDARCAALAKVAATAEELASSAAAASRSLGPVPFPFALLQRGAPAFPLGSREMMESVASSVFEAAMRVGAGKR